MARLASIGLFCAPTSPFSSGLSRLGADDINGLSRLGADGINGLSRLGADDINGLSRLGADDNNGLSRLGADGINGLSRFAAAIATSCRDIGLLLQALATGQVQHTHVGRGYGCVCL